MWMCVDGEVCVCLLLCAGTGSGMTMSYVNSWHAHVHLWCVPEGAGRPSISNRFLCDPAWQVWGWAWVWDSLWHWDWSLGILGIHPSKQGLSSSQAVALAMTSLSNQVGWFWAWLPAGLLPVKAWRLTRANQVKVTKQEKTRGSFCSGR